ncbi:hypothetical protein [Hymenobacter bucti]|uniref:hypothetical protein n=1 Tax=Hymenobacter bucti TaxID=1844114 RepID=UPI0036D2757E
MTGAAGAAGDNISSWTDLLQDSPQLTNVSTELENLQDILSSGDIDGSEVASSLRKLGQLTTEAAASATPDTQDKLMQLGQTLSSAATQL